MSPFIIYAAYNLCRTHETLRTTPAVPLGIADHAWSIGELIDVALATQPITPETTAPDRRRLFRIIDGGEKIGGIDKLSLGETQRIVSDTQ